MRESIDIITGSNARFQPTFTLGNRMRRLIWKSVWALFGRSSPVFMHRWRAWLLRVFGAQIHKTAHVYPTAEIWAPWNLSLSCRTCLGPGVKCYNVDKVYLAPRATVSQGSHLCTASRDYGSEKFSIITGAITIGTDAWVAAECFIGPNVNIGEGAVLGARAVVLRSTQPFVLMIGNPATLVKTLRGRDHAAT
jgi:putative colanic acid biosynthesis acetyltransferase WcaF